MGGLVVKWVIARFKQVSFAALVQVDKPTCVWDENQGKNQGKSLKGGFAGRGFTLFRRF